MTLHSEHPGNLPLLPMGWGAANLDFDTAEDFWAEAQRVASGASLGENLDIALAGESAPRIWLFLHEPGQGAMSAAAALTMAHELGARDQAVLILDCDDDQSRLTHWAGRHEAEGWIDMVRYGASVLTSGVALPFGGRRGYVLGVGSFTPTEVEPHEAEDLVNRLKRQADDLMLVAPADAAGLLWGPLADIRLLCWDRARRSAETIEQVIAGFEESDAQLTGLIGFGLPDEGVAFGTDQPQEEAPVAAGLDEEAFADEDTDDRLEAADLHDVDYTEEEAEDPVADGVAEDLPDTEDSAADTAEAKGAVPALDADPVLRLGPLGDEDGADHGSGSSRVFWGTALVSLALILVVGFYYFKVIRVSDDGGVAVPAVVADMHGATAPANLKADPGQEPDAAGNDQLGGDAAGAQEKTDAAETGAAEIPAGETTADQTANTAAAPVEQAKPEEAPVEEPAPAEPAGPVFTMDPYLQPVGTDGWALHLYSFPDSLTAGKETRILQRRGFQTAIRAVEIKDKGRWYRVYVGSFLNKGEAMEAQQLLMKELKLDWARPTEF